MFGNGLFATRALSVLTGSVSVLLGMWLLLLISARRAAVLGGVLLALLPIAVRYSQEVRMYALLGLLMLGATIALVYWLKTPRYNRALAVYVVLAAAGLYTHYFAAVSLLSHWVYLLVLMYRKDVPHKYLTVKSWWLANLAIALAFVPWIPNLLHQLAFSGFYWIKQPDIHTVVSTLWMFVGYTDGLAFSPWVFYSLPCLLFIGALVVVMHDSSRHKYSSMIVLYVWFPLFFIIVVSFVRPLFVVRYFMFAALGLPIILALALNFYWQRHKLCCQVFLVVIVFVESVGIYNVAGVGHVVYKEVNSIDVMSEYLNKQANVDDAVLVTHAFLYFPLVYYNTSGIIPKFYAPPNADGTLSRPNGTLIWTLVQDNAEQIFVGDLDSLQSRSGRIWLLGEYKGGTQVVAFPKAWRLMSTFIVGDTQLQLFETEDKLSPDSASLP
ncbi:glycosyltransferase family 39 protein [Pseudomonas prosekii]|uniref:glycosyltransferase family 39 protein n=1 Tax=Pseudomonas prosekii TaxID=1148509 RepID=UPI003F74B212